MNYIMTTSKPVTGAQGGAEHQEHKEQHIQYVCVCVQESCREIAVIKVNKCGGIKQKSR